MMDEDNAWLAVPHFQAVGLVASSARRVGEISWYTEGHGQPSFCIIFGTGFIILTETHSQPEYKL